ncbi:MAG: polymer-forming cytoskeletal protein [Alphaproteobacteria bacterium]|nr:MAG: polymer-forming cytoskeletal protein [Alphaproteobacteria bacterium]
MWKHFARNSKEGTMAKDKPGSQTHVASGAPSIISAGVRLIGELTSPGDVQLDGTVEGDLRCRQLTIGDGGSVKGEITADQATIRGRVEGELRVKSLRLGSKAEVIGDIYQETIAIEAGARISGRIILGLERAAPLHKSDKAGGAASAGAATPAAGPAGGPATVVGSPQRAAPHKLPA